MGANDWHCYDAKWDSTSDLQIREIPYNKGHLANLVGALMGIYRYSISTLFSYLFHTSFKVFHIISFGHEHCCLTQRGEHDL